MGGVVLVGPERHRRFSDEQKIAIVGESFLPAHSHARISGRN
ncbi:MAG: hypothetical protein O9286_14830 [Aquidulcibacter sp.]|nr:hypothetical protein [Aquidulcibacter sp.]